MKELTIQDIERIVREDENRMLVVKQTTGELYDGICSGCAFLNTDGGWLLFGITPKLRIVGQDVSDSTRQEIAREMRRLAPSIDLAAQYIDVPDSGGRKVIAIWFPGSDSHGAYVFDGRPYYKVENTTAQMPLQMFEERIKMNNPRRFSWELSPCLAATMDDIDIDILTGAINGGIVKGRIPASATNAVTIPERLSPFKVLTDGDLLTNGAVVLFGKDPNKFFHHCKVRLARFEGVIMDKFRDQVVVEANLFRQLQAIEDFCRKHMFMSGNQDQFDSKNELTVPLKVVREAALNLLIHRTWWSEARVPSVNIFDDRVEFMNPGAFPPGTTPEDFRRRPHSEPINEIIANALFKGGVSEGWGRGILDIFTLCREAKLPEPVYDFVPHFVCLTIQFKKPLKPYLTNKGRNETLNETLERTLYAIRKEPGVKRKELVNRLGLAAATVSRHITQLTVKGLIEHRGSKKTGGYYAK